MYLKRMKSLVEMNLTCLPYLHLALLPKNPSSETTQTNRLLLRMIEKTEKSNFRLAKRLRNYCERLGIILRFVRGPASLSKFWVEFDKFAEDNDLA